MGYTRGASIDWVYIGCVDLLYMGVHQSINWVKLQGWKKTLQG